jgi:hypothetical protein
MDDDKNNIFSLVNGGKSLDTDDQELPNYSYVIVDREGEEFYASGFMIFTSQHVAIMRDTGKGAIPVIVMPLERLHIAELVEDQMEFVPEDDIL